MQKLMALAASASLLALAACGNDDVRNPVTGPRASVSPVAPSLAKSRQLQGEHDGARREEGRSGILHVTKECSQFSGLPGSFCTITASNLDEIKAGWRVVYISGPNADGSINSDVVLGPPGGGPSVAFGHCDVSSAPNGTNLGLCRFSGGTGEFTHFRGRFVVSGNDPLGIVYHWDGPYSFGPDDREEGRSGTLHVTKECSQYTGLAGSFCTITSSNLEEIKVGWRVVYASAAGAGSLNSDVVLGPPGGGPNTAFGHVTLNLATGLGEITFAGGTGEFTWFHASIAVIVNFKTGVTYWDGTYSFSPRD